MRVCAARGVRGGCTLGQLVSRLPIYMAAIPVLLGIAGTVAVGVRLRRWYRGTDDDAHTPAEPAQKKQPEPLPPRKQGKLPATKATKTMFDVEIVLGEDTLLPATMLVGARGIEMGIGHGDDYEQVTFPITLITSWRALPNGFLFSYWPDDAEPTYDADGRTHLGTTSLEMRTPDGTDIAAACKRAANAVVMEMVRRDAAAAAAHEAESANAARARKSAASPVSAPADLLLANARRRTAMKRAAAAAKAGTSQEEAAATSYAPPAGAAANVGSEASAPAEPTHAAAEDDAASSGAAAAGTAAAASSARPTLKIDDGAGAESDHPSLAASTRLPPKLESPH